MPKKRGNVKKGGSGMRTCGILLPVFSLWSPYGIGSFSRSAYEFVDWLARAGQSYWQILPLGPTGYGDSPYQSFSTFAGNPYFIDLDRLIQAGLLTKEECAGDWGGQPDRTDYGKIYEHRFPVLRKAYERSGCRSDGAFLQFCNEQREWLAEYSLYMAVKDHFGGVSWNEWDEDIRRHNPQSVAYYRKQFADEIGFYQYLQYLFWNQWTELKQYANNKGIKIIGDIPIYVAFDSADTWANPRMFQFNERYEPVAVAGCPPDGFSATGQLWGNPLYNWEYHEKTGFEWWIRRMTHCFQLYDVVRVDHFRGFDAYYSIPYGSADACHGTWNQGVGMRLFQCLREKLGDVAVIAEDLGYVTDSVRKLVNDTGYPGMKVLEFAFDSREEGDYLPHNYGRNNVVYTGTHDNQTIVGWYQELSPQDRKMAMDYLNLYGRDEKQLHLEFVRAALASVADTAVIPIQDYLGLGAEARINTPSTLGGNWTFRLQEGQLTDEQAQKIYEMNRIYGRLAFIKDK